MKTDRHESKLNLALYVGTRVHCRHSSQHRIGDFGNKFKRNNYNIKGNNAEREVDCESEEEDGDSSDDDSDSEYVDESDDDSDEGD